MMRVTRIFDNGVEFTFHLNEEELEEAYNIHKTNLLKKTIRDILTKQEPYIQYNFRFTEYYTYYNSINRICRAYVDMKNGSSDYNENIIDDVKLMINCIDDEIWYSEKDDFIQVMNFYRLSQENKDTVMDNRKNIFHNVFNTPYDARPNIFHIEICKLLGIEKPGKSIE